MSEFKPHRCRACGEGTVCLQYQSTPLLVEPVAVPTCDHCGALWINPKTAEAIDAASAEAGGGLSGVDSDIHGEPETSLREFVSDDESVRRQAPIEAIGIAEFANAEWDVIVNHVRLMRENWDRFVADAVSYKKRRDVECKVAQAVAVELRAELHAVRETLLAQDGEGTCDAVIRWRNDLRQLESDMHDIDDARGMLCGELVIDDSGNTVEILRQAALAIARHRLSTEALNKTRAELAAADGPRLDRDALSGRVAELERACRCGARALRSHDEESPTARELDSAAEGRPSAYRDTDEGAAKRRD